MIEGADSAAAPVVVRTTIQAGFKLYGQDQPLFEAVNATVSYPKNTTFSVALLVFKPLSTTST